MNDFETLGAFYLGRQKSLDGASDPANRLLLYHSKDLVTHAVCVGMTGSGKTGLCISLLEEAAIDGIPSIVIDPKGDLGNLLLQFPSLRPQDFQPWIAADDARAAGQTEAEYATAEAERWKQGLAGWGQDGERIARLQASADFAIYTPGSSAGLPLAVLKSFAAPVDGASGGELFRDRVTGTASAVLSLVGRDANPRGREHILLSSIFGTLWRQGESLDLAALIHLIQKPPLERIGVLDLESFFPAANRFELAMELNNLLASPDFEAWLEGEPLDVHRLFYTEAGKPRVSVVSISHLDDGQRMFLVSLLLNEVLSWMRAQPGSSSLRAILYMDEIFGYFPPTANPPSKRPLLTMLKQARAFGLGVVLATQNPVDLDYKGLSNAGTWFIGRLQTEQDKARLMDGLDAAADDGGAGFDRAAMDRLLAGLGKRTFLLNNVHEDGPILFETRWALSYLRGPLTRGEVQRLMSARKNATQAAPALPGRTSAKAAAAGTSRMLMPASLPHVYLPASGSAAPLLYYPALLSIAQIHYVATKPGLDHCEETSWLTPFDDGPLAIDWKLSGRCALDPALLRDEPEAGANFAPLPASATKLKNYASWRKEFTGWLTVTQSLEMFRSSELKIASAPGEPESAFRARVSLALREERDRLAAMLRAKYAPKIVALETRIERAQQALEREQAQAQAQTWQSVMDVGSGFLGAVLGKRAPSRGNLGRASSAVRSLNRRQKEAGDVERAGENLEGLLHQLSALQATMSAEVEQAATRIAPASIPLDRVRVRPKKANITVRLCVLAWAPYRTQTSSALSPAWE